MKSKKLQAAVLVSALALGYAGAATYSAWAEPAIEVADGYGEGDGLTRYALTTHATAGDDLLAALEAAPGVASAQWVDDGIALVAVDGVAPDRLRAVPGVDGVELSPSVPVLGTIDDPYARAYGYNLENTGSNAYQQPAVADADVDAATGWDTGTGAGRIVAVVDSGFDSDHPDLAGSLWTNPDQPCGSTDTDGNGLAGDCHGWNFYTNSADIDNGSMGTHGTAVSGVVGARVNGVGTAGVAPDVAIMPLVIGGGSTVDVNLGARAIRYAVDHGADVINASWGGQISGQPLTNLRSAVAYAAAHDVLVVAAAGNDDGLNRDSVLMYPASLPDANIVTVGSSTAADTMAAHSDYGPTSVDLFAPGELLPIPWNDGGMRVGSGTSYAAPHVAAAIALYRAVMPTATHADLKAALLADVDRRPAFAGRSVTGGRLTMEGLAARAAEPVRYAFTSMTARAGTVAPTIGISTPASSGRYSVDVGLGMEHAGQIWALADEPVTLDGATVPTNDAGDARFDLGDRQALDGLALSPSMDLAAGRYVLTVQMYRDGEPLGRMHAAPLLVSSTDGSTPSPQPPGTPGTPAPGGSTPPSGGTTPTPGTPTPGPTTPAPGGSTPVPTTPGPTSPAPNPGTPTPGSPTPGTPNPGTTPPAPGGSTPTPTTPGPTSPAPNPGTPTPGSPTPGTTTPAPGGSTPAPTTPGGTSPGSPTPGTPTPAPGGGTLPVPGTKTYPEAGAFRITSLSPDAVTTAGGTLVTVRGLALPSSPTVRIGSSATATIMQSTATSLVFRVPARTAGTYDVTVSNPGGTAVVLTGALRYADVLGSGTGPTTPGTTGPGTTPGVTPPGGSTPGGTAPGGTSPGTGTPPAAAPTEAAGPAGERLVRSDRFRGLAHVWSLNCSVTCTGVAI